VIGVRLLGIGTVAVLGLAGCATAPAGTLPAPVASTGAAPSPSRTGPVLGQSAPADNGQVEATVFEYRQPVADAAPSGGVWGAADVQVCVVRSAIFDVTISQGPWLVVAPDGGTVGPRPVSDVRFPQPGYPTDHRRLAPGQCVRGWLMFALPGTARVVAVRYAPAGGRPINWPVG
jgi:hypothetical protein